MDTSTFEQFRRLIYEESGITLSPDKIPLLSSRIGRRLRALNLGSPGEYLRIVETDASGEELINLIDAVSTNTTHFYREPQHFDIFGELLKQHIASGKKEIKIWCAASSSGEEPYTLALTVLQNVNTKQIKTKILATDICTTVIRKALRGHYTEDQLSKIPAELRKKYFSKIDTEDGEKWSISQEPRELLTFRKFNLAKFPYPVKGPVDFIFLRNVMIYFDRTLRQQILDQMCPILAPGGYFFLSHSENLLSIQHPLKSIAPSVYRKPA